MTKLEKKVQKDFSEIQKRMNALFDFFMSEIGQKIDAANQDVIGTVAYLLATHTDISFNALRIHGTLKRIERTIKHRYENLAGELEIDWDKRRQQFDLMSRLSSNFIALKSSPPWIKNHLNLKDPLTTDGSFDPRMGHFHYLFKNMAEAIIKQIERGAINEETLNQILNRVRGMFDNKNKQGVREAREPGLDYSINDDSTQMNLSGAIDVSEGIYTLEDVEKLQAAQVKAMNWESRQYRPYFSDSLKANNRYLRDLEQLLMSDAIDQLHSGLLQIGSKEMGIDDFTWVVSRPQPVCDECTIRDGMTMKEIKAKIKDDFGSQPPPLHPNCRCQLVPKIKKDWADKELEKDGIRWNPNDGLTYNASKQEIKSGIPSMSFDEYLKAVGG